MDVSERLRVAHSAALQAALFAGKTMSVAQSIADQLYPRPLPRYRVVTLDDGRSYRFNTEKNEVEMQFGDGSGRWGVSANYAYLRPGGKIPCDRLPVLLSDPVDTVLRVWELVQNPFEA